MSSEREQPPTQEDDPTEPAGANDPSAEQENEDAVDRPWNRDESDE
jgi:hypothetical protein